MAAVVMSSSRRKYTRLRRRQNTMDMFPSWMVAYRLTSGWTTEYVSSGAVRASNVNGVSMQYMMSERIICMIGKTGVLSISSGLSRG